MIKSKKYWNNHDSTIECTSCYSTFGICKAVSFIAETVFPNHYKGICTEHMLNLIKEYPGLYEYHEETSND